MGILKRLLKTILKGYLVLSKVEPYMKSIVFVITILFTALGAEANESDEKCGQTYGTDSVIILA